MGRWAQARRRSSPVTLVAATEAPPAPLLASIADHLVQTAQGADDTGGQVELEGSDSFPYDWVPYEDAAWTAVKDWGAVGELVYQYYRAREIGNGVAYIGASEWSNVVMP